MDKWIDKLELVEDELNVRVMRGLVEAFGNSRAGSTVRQEISASLHRAGWRHQPAKLPTISTWDRMGNPVPIYVYKSGSVADRLFTSIIKPEMLTVETARRAVKLLSRDD